MTLARTYNALLAQAPVKKPNILETPYKRTSVQLSANARIGGLLIIGASGTGKSIMTGKHFALSDCQNAIPQVIIDVGGQCIQNFLLSLLFLDKQTQLELLQRVMYCDTAAADGYTFSWSFLHPRRQNERLFVTSSRLPELLAQLDVNYSNATIQGLTRAIPIATMVGKLLSALNLPLIFVFDLLRKPEQWEKKISQLKHQQPELYEAIDDFLDYLALSKRIRNERVEPFLNRLYLLRHDEVVKAMFGTTRAPTIDFEKVSSSGQTVLIDLSQEKSKDARQFKLLYIFNALLEYIESRGRGVPPMSVLIDELSYFVRGAAHVNTRVIAEKFRELIEQRMRNNGVYLTLATQDMKQIPPEMLSACLNMKSFLFSAQSDPETSTYLADRFMIRDPWEVKYWERVWATDSGSPRAGIPSRHFVIDHRPVFLPLEEALYLNSRKFMSPKLQKGTWLFAQSQGEGEVPSSVRRVATPHLFAPPFASEHTELLQKLRRYLAQRDGIPLSVVLGEIAELEQEIPQQSELQQVPQTPSRSALPEHTDLPSTNGQRRTTRTGELPPD